jgi:hypothetical protein
VTPPPKPKVTTARPFRSVVMFRRNRNDDEPSEVIGAAGGAQRRRSGVEARGLDIGRRWQRMAGHLGKRSQRNGRRQRAGPPWLSTRILLSARSRGVPAAVGEPAGGPGGSRSRGKPLRRSDRWICGAAASEPPVQGCRGVRSASALPISLGCIVAIAGGDTSCGKRRAGWARRPTRSNAAGTRSWCAGGLTRNLFKGRGSSPR